MTATSAVDVVCTLDAFGSCGEARDYGGSGLTAASDAPAWGPTWSVARIARVGRQLPSCAGPRRASNALGGSRCET